MNFATGQVFLDPTNWSNGLLGGACMAGNPAAKVILRLGEKDGSLGRGTVPELLRTQMGLLLVSVTDIAFTPHWSYPLTERPSIGPAPPDLCKSKR